MSLYASKGRGNCPNVDPCWQLAGVCWYSTTSFPGHLGLVPAPPSLVVAVVIVVVVVVVVVSSLFLNIYLRDQRMKE